MLLRIQCLLILILLGLSAKGQDLSSPHNETELYINPSALTAQAHFSIYYHKIALLQHAKCALIQDKNLNLDQQFAYSHCSPFIKVDDSWTDPLSGEFISNIYNKKEYYFKRKDSLNSASRCTLEFRVFDKALAYRFKVISYTQSYYGDQSNYPFPATDSAWWMPSDCFAFEGLYKNGLIENISTIVNTPFLGHRGDSLWYAIHEAALLHYPLSDLQSNEYHQLETRLRYGSDDSLLMRKYCFTTPWRVLSFGNTAADIANSKVISSLNEACKIANTSWIKPLKFNGIWWEMHEGILTWPEGKAHGATTKRTKEYIAFANEFHLGGTLTEGWNSGWDNYGTSNQSKQNFAKAATDFNWDEVLRYAKEKNVNWIAHHETQADYKHYDSVAEWLFKDLHKKGVHYLKTGYAGVGMEYGQAQIEHFQKIVEIAAKYEICLDVHESIMPSGIERTWPNLLTQEAGRGNEWNATYKGLPPYYATVLPFTRQFAGAFDYTPGLLNLFNNTDHRKRGYTTLAHEIALYVVLYSPMSMLAQDIFTYSNYRKEYTEAFKFMANIPPVWQDRKVIQSRPGDYVVTRALQTTKQDSIWYLAAIADENAYQIKVPLDFLSTKQEYVATIFSDNRSTQWQSRPRDFSVNYIAIKASDTFTMSLAKAGGATVRIVTRAVFDQENKAQEKPIIQIPLWNRMNYIYNAVFQHQSTYGYAYRKDTHAVVHYSSRYDSNYPAQGDLSLTDGKISYYDFSDGNWQGFFNKDIDVTIDLPKNEVLHQAMIHCLASPDDWIYFPRKVSVIVLDSNNQVVKSFIHEYNELPKEENGQRKTDDFEIDLLGVTGKYLRVKVYNPGPCPKDSKGAGNPSWLFCDEIVWR